MKIIFTLVYVVVFQLHLQSRAAESKNVTSISGRIKFFLAQTNSDTPALEFKSDQTISSILVGVTTNATYLRCFPVYNYDFEMTDSQGNQITKTKFGMRLTGYPQLPSQRTDLINYKSSHYAPFFIDSSTIRRTLMFRPDEVFQITNKDVYSLRVKIRLCVIMTNGLPDVAAMQDGRNATLKGLNFINNFGILTSQSLNVRIVK